jgi:hypothetical protein
MGRRQDRDETIDDILQITGKKGPAAPSAEDVEVSLTPTGVLPI